jgi:hypothetical protein
MSSVRVIIGTENTDDSGFVPFREGFEYSDMQTLDGEQLQTASDTAEALNVGGISTINGLSIKAVSNEVAIDLSYSTAFVSDLIIPHGKSIFVTEPAGTIYLKATSATELARIKFKVFGS